MNYPYLRRLPKFEYLLPTTVEEALSFLARYEGEARPLAGGTDLLIKMKRRELTSPYLIGLKGIPGLDGMDYDRTSGLRIGPLVTLHTVETSSLIKKRYPVLSWASSTIGSLQIRNLGTVVGNVCNALPSADMVPSLIVLGGKVKVLSVREEKLIAIEDFIIGPGETCLRNDELVTEIQVPTSPPSTGCAYIKHTQREAMDLAIVSVAVSITLEGEVCNESRICLGTVGPTPMRAKRAEEVLKGKILDDKKIREASEEASEEVQPRTTLRGSAWYRKEMVKVLTEKALKKALEEVKG